MKNKVHRNFRIQLVLWTLIFLLFLFDSILHGGPWRYAGYSFAALSLMSLLYWYSIKRLGMVITEETAEEPKEKAEK